MIQRKLVRLAVLAAIATPSAALAQNHTLLFCLDSDEVTLDNGNGHVEVGRIGEEEVASVTPGTGFYSARPFLPRSAQWAYLGDADADGRYADASEGSPGGDIDCLFVRNAVPIAAPFNPRDVFISKEGDADMASGFEDGDVFRYANGGIEVFMTEAQLRTALGVVSASVDLNALCQTAAGDLYLSISLDVAPYTDEDLIHIPAMSIAYDVDGLITTITASSAVVVANKTDFDALITNSGFRTSVGGTLSATSFTDLSALEIDPNGGTWTPTSSAATVPNLLFAWTGFSNDGGIISTRNGGEIATINGIPMASQVATQGTQIGVLPGSTGIFGLEGIALIPLVPGEVPVVENYPVDLHTATSTDTSWHEFELASMTPNSFAHLFVAVGPSTPGGFVASLPYGFVTNEFFTGVAFAPVIAVPTDALGYGAVSFLIPPLAVLPGVNVTIQAIDVTTLKASVPAALQFI